MDRSHHSPAGSSSTTTMDVQPLDLSSTAATPPTTNAITLADVAARFSVIQKPPSPPSILPTCTNPGLNSNWIAIKFGAAVGPNRMSYPREFKLMVIDYYYAHGHNKYRTCKEFQITKSMLNGWLQKIDKIRQSRPGSLKSGRSGRRPQFPDIEKQLYGLYTTHLGTGQKVGNRWIRETARTLAQQQCTQQELAGMCQFSERWLSNFKKRYHINLNRDWSSGASLGESSNSSVDCCSSSVSPKEHSHPQKEEKDDDEFGPLMIDGDDEEEEDDDEDEDEIDDEDETTAVSPSAMTAEILGKSAPGQLPIHTFYQRFPWLCRRTPTLVNEPGRRGRKVQFPQVEKVLYERMVERQASGQRVSNRWLQEQARTLAAQLCPQVLAEATKSARCMFSEHWLHNFKKRYGVSLKQQQQQLAAAAAAAASAASKSSPIPAQLLDEPSATPSPQPSMPTALSPSALATMLQMQQWFLQQCYLNSLSVASATGNTTTTNDINGSNLPTMVPLLRTAWKAASTPPVAAASASPSPQHQHGTYLQQQQHV